MLVTCVSVLHVKTASSSQFVWLAGVAGVFIAYTLALTERSAEETMHFIQYAGLGYLVPVHKRRS